MTPAPHPQAGSFPGAGPRGRFPESTQEQPGLWLLEEAAAAKLPVQGRAWWRWGAHRKAETPSTSPPDPWPSCGASPLSSAPHAPFPIAGIKVVLVWVPLVASWSPRASLAFSVPSSWLPWLQWWVSWWGTHSPPSSGAPCGVGSPKTSLASTPTPASTGAPAMFSCCTRTRSKCCFLFLPEAKLLLYFLELLIVNLRVFKREAKYIPLVNE